MSRTFLPQKIAEQMRLYTLGYAPLPETYIAFHEGLAKAALMDLKARGYIIHRHYMETDGWLDGMMILHAIVEGKGKLFKLRWHDGNQGWFRCHLNCGGVNIFNP